ncbi:MAG: N-glycosylase/DNA lyase [Candidatus Thermoplasmatota archaeon]|nr:N-glycosylase/DNA lyase [Candidatus Thermoplasmatota archaeon]
MDEKKLKERYSSIEGEIHSRIDDFKSLWDEGEEDKIFDELTFCLFTPQSKAKVCWDTVEKLRENEMIEEGEKSEIADEIKRVRFRHNKSEYLVEAREKFLDDDFSLREKLKEFDDPKEARRWIVDNIKGLGLKESSHFLRNIGYTQDLAILDRHILKNLEELDVIEEVPKTLTKKRYLEIEEKMKRFSKEVEIPLGHLDLVLWHEETGHIFK